MKNCILLIFPITGGTYISSGKVKFNLKLKSNWTPADRRLYEISCVYDGLVGLGLSSRQQNLINKL